MNILLIFQEKRRSRWYMGPKFENRHVFCWIYSAIDDSHDDVIKWKHFPRYMAICAGNSLVTSEFLAQRPVRRSFDVFFDPRLNKWLSKHWWGWWWFETPSRPSWCHYNAKPLLWRHNGQDGVSNHQPHDCLLNRLFGHRSKKTSKLRVIGLCAGNSPVPVNSPHKGPVTRKMFPFDDVIMHHFYQADDIIQNGRRDLLKVSLINENLTLRKGLWTTRTQDISYPGQLVPKPTRTQDWVRVVLGTSCPGYELSWVRVVLGTSCPGYELSWVRVVQIPLESNNI